MTSKELVSLKEKYWNLYYIDIEGYEFLYRELSRYEYKQIIRTLEVEVDREDQICDTCVIEPKDFDYDNCPAGIPNILARNILLASGFGEDDGQVGSWMEKYRQEISTFDHQISCIIHEAFNEFTLEEIESWPLEKTIWYYTRAEYVLSLRNIHIEFNSTDGSQPPQNTVTKAPPQPTAEAAPSDGATKVSYELVGENSNTSDFPELRAIEKFMRGELF